MRPMIQCKWPNGHKWVESSWQPRVATLEHANRLVRDINRDKNMHMLYRVAVRVPCGRREL